MSRFNSGAFSITFFDESNQRWDLTGLQAESRGQHVKITGFELSFKLDMKDGGSESYAVKNDETGKVVQVKSDDERLDGLKGRLRTDASGKVPVILKSVGVCELDTMNKEIRSKSPVRLTLGGEITIDGEGYYIGIEQGIAVLRSNVEARVPFMREGQGGKVAKEDELKITADRMELLREGKMVRAIEFSKDEANAKNVSFETHEERLTADKMLIYFKKVQPVTAEGNTGDLATADGSAEKMTVELQKIEAFGNVVFKKKQASFAGGKGDSEIVVKGDMAIIDDFASRQFKQVVLRGNCIIEGDRSHDGDASCSIAKAPEVLYDCETQKISVKKPDMKFMKISKTSQDAEADDYEVKITSERMEIVPVGEAGARRVIEFTENVQLEYTAYAGGTNEVCEDKAMVLTTDRGVVYFNAGVASGREKTVRKAEDVPVEKIEAIGNVVLYKKKAPTEKVTGDRGIIDEFTSKEKFKVTLVGNCQVGKDGQFARVPKVEYNMNLAVPAILVEDVDITYKGKKTANREGGEATGGAAYEVNIITASLEIPYDGQTMQKVKLPNEVRLEYTEYGGSSAAGSSSETVAVVLRADSGEIYFKGGEALAPGMVLDGDDLSRVLEKIELSGNVVMCQKRDSSEKVTGDKAVIDEFTSSEKFNVTLRGNCQIERDGLVAHAYEVVYNTADEKIISEEVDITYKGTKAAANNADTTEQQALAGAYEVNIVTASMVILNDGNENRKMELPNEVRLEYTEYADRVVAENQQAQTAMVLRADKGEVYFKGRGMAASAGESDELSRTLEKIELAGNVELYKKHDSTEKVTGDIAVLDEFRSMDKFRVTLRGAEDRPCTVQKDGHIVRAPEVKYNLNLETPKIGVRDVDIVYRGTKAGKDGNAVADKGKPFGGYEVRIKSASMDIPYDGKAIDVIEFSDKVVLEYTDYEDVSSGTANGPAKKTVIVLNAGSGAVFFKKADVGAANDEAAGEVKLEGADGIENLAGELDRIELAGGVEMHNELEHAETVTEETALRITGEKAVLDEFKSTEDFKVTLSGKDGKPCVVQRGAHESQAPVIEFYRNGQRIVPKNSKSTIRLKKTVKTEGRRDDASAEGVK